MGHFLYFYKQSAILAQNSAIHDKHVKSILLACEKIANFVPKIDQNRPKSPKIAQNRPKSPKIAQNRSKSPKNDHCIDRRQNFF
jgi:hypothetical protein